MDSGKKIAILGASGQIGRGLSDRLRIHHKVVGFGRTAPSLPIESIADQEFDLIINAAGPGDPSVHRRKGSDIYQITEDLDRAVLSYLNKRPKTKYIYLSTGAIYQFYDRFPGAPEGSFKVPSLGLEASNHYALAKLLSEVKHRSFNDLKIWDIRIFGYIGSQLDIESGFFLSEVARAILRKEEFITNPDDFVRDYIDDEQLARMIELLIEKDPPNGAFDIYSASPLTKFELLDSLSKKFSLNFRVQGIRQANAGCPGCITLDRASHLLGYLPGRTSMAVVHEALSGILNGRINGRSDTEGSI